MSGKSETCNFREEMHKIFLRPVEGVNVASAENGAKMVKAEMDANALNEDLETFPCHEIGNMEGESLEGIVIELRDNYLLNRIKFLLLDNGDDRSYSYFLEVSMNGKTLTRIRDYTMYFCKSWQLIGFTRNCNEVRFLNLRYIKIVGTHNSINNKFHVVTIQACLARDEIKLSRWWNVLGLMTPKDNVATVEYGAKVIKGKGGNYMINGDLTRQSISNFTCHIIDSQPIELQLSQPYVLDSMRFLLWDADDRVYSYEINVSTYLVRWETVARRQNKKSWQNLKFERIPVVFIRIMGTYNSKNNELLG